MCGAGHPEFDYDDSDRSSVYSTPSPQTRQFQTLAASSVAMTTASAAAAVGGAGGYGQPMVGMTAYHPSLRKKKWFDRQSSVNVLAGRQSMLEKSWSLQADRPLSLLAPYSTESSIIANKVADTLLQQVISPHHTISFRLSWSLTDHHGPNLQNILGKILSLS